MDLYFVNRLLRHYRRLVAKYCCTITYILVNYLLYYTKI